MGMYFLQRIIHLRHIHPNSSGITGHPRHCDIPVWQETQDVQVIHRRSLPLPDGSSAQLSVVCCFIGAFYPHPHTPTHCTVIVVVDASNKWTREHLHPNIVQALASNAQVPSVLALNKACTYRPYFCALTFWGFWCG